eukprot:142327-Rhodomonas_salina.1
MEAIAMPDASIMEVTSTGVAINRVDKKWWHDPYMEAILMGFGINGGSWKGRLTWGKVLGCAAQRPRAAPRDAHASALPLG